MLRDAYREAFKPDKGRILDEVQATTGLARSSARRLLRGPKLPDPCVQADKRALRARTYNDASRELLTHLWLLMAPFTAGRGGCGSAIRDSRR